MKVALLVASIALAAYAEITIDYDQLKKTSEVEYSTEDCGEWDDYKCCSKKDDCEGLQKGGSDKKTKKKRENARDKHCVKDSKKCCGADINYNWNNGVSTAVEHDEDEGKNTKGDGCDSGESCVAEHLLKHADDADGKHVNGYELKYLIGAKTGTKCLKKSTFKKVAKKANSDHKKKVKKTKKTAKKKFDDNEVVDKFLDKGHKCGNFDHSTFKCCLPDKHFCSQVGADERELYCIRKEEVCCNDFQYSEGDIHATQLILTKKAKKMTYCKKSSDDKYCVVKSHDESNQEVEVKCTDKNGKARVTDIEIEAADEPVVAAP